MRRTGGKVALALLVTGLVLALVPWPQVLAERVYLGTLLPAWSAVTAPLIDRVGPSLSGLVLVALIAAPLLALVLFGSLARRAVLGLWLVAALTLLLLFPLTFGLGYRLPALQEAHGLSADGLTEAERTQVAALVLSALHESVPADARVAAEPPAGRGASDAVAAASHCVARLTGQLRGDFPAVTLPQRVKALPAGIMLRFGFAGVVSPWLLEPHVDAGLPPASALGVALHELAHTAGYAAEAEAEAVGLVAGLECHDPRVVYAAALRLAGNMSAALTPAQRNALLDSWPAQARADARAHARATERYADDALAPGAAAVYDIYLRSQGEAAGIREYDRGTELALQLYLARHAPAPSDPASPGP